MLCVQDLAGLRMNMLNQNTIKVFKSMSGIYQDHYPVSGPRSASCPHQGGLTPAPTPTLPASCLWHQISSLTGCFHSYHRCPQCAPCFCAVPHVPGQTYAGICKYFVRHVCNVRSIVHPGQASHLDQPFAYVLHFTHSPCSFTL